MTKLGPFEYVKSINNKQKETDLVGYNPFLTNRAFAYHIDTILLAEEMNQANSLGPELQYDFYYYAVRKGERFGFPPKVEEPHNLHIVMDYFNISKQKALEALQVLTLNDINDIIGCMNKGGR